MYKPIVPVNNRVGTQTSVMARGGMNLRDLPQMMNLKYAQSVVNYLIAGSGGLIKRKGIRKIFEIAGNVPIHMVENFTNDIVIFSYGVTTAAYTISTNTVVTIKNNWSVGNHSGQRYGDYFFVCNGVEKIHRITRTFTYAAQTANFTLGTRVTGATSGASGIILEDADAGLTGTLTLGNITGTFLNGEVINDTNGGSATTSSVVGFAITEVTGAPAAGKLRVINSRLFAGDLKDDESALAYSAIDSGANPPFTSWATGTLANEPGRVYNRQIGRTNSIEPLGEFIVVFGEFGKYAFYINTIDSGGAIKKEDVFAMSRTDAGGATGAYTSEVGLLYANEAGLFELISVGQDNVPFSDQDFKTSQLLGDSYFSNISLANCDIMYDETSQSVLVACARNSVNNNLVIVLNKEFGAFTEIRGWNPGRFVKIDQTIYMGSSINTKFYRCFDGFSDDGLNIGTEFYQEIPLGGLETKKNLHGFYIQGFLSLGSVITVSFDIYDEQGRFIQNKKRFTWTAQSNNNLSDGYGVASWGTSAFGGDLDLAGTVESFDGCMPTIRNLQRLRVRITSGDKLLHALNWFSVQSEEIGFIRRRKLVEI